MAMLGCCRPQSALFDAHCLRMCAGRPADISSADISAHFNSVYEFLSEAERLKQRKGAVPGVHSCACLCARSILQILQLTQPSLHVLCKL